MIKVQNRAVEGKKPKFVDPWKVVMIINFPENPSCSCQPSFSSRKDLKPDIHKRSTVPINVMDWHTIQVVYGNRKQKMPGEQSICPASTFPSRSFHNATSPSDFQTPRCDAARPPIRKIKCLGLRMPYPNTGPFDEAQAVSKGYFCQMVTKVQGAVAQKLWDLFWSQAWTKFLGRSLRLGQCFITGARRESFASLYGVCLLTNEEMTLINKGFAEANSNQPSYGTQNDGRPHQVFGQNQTLSDSDGFHLETLESDLPKYVNTDIHIKNKANKGLKDDIATDHSKATIDKEKRQDGCKNQEESRRLTLRKSLDWDCAFLPSAGLLSFEELSLINRGFKTADPIQSISRACKHIQTHIGSHQDQTSSKSGDLPLGALEAELFKDVKPDIHKLNKKSNVCKTASFTSSTTENNPKVHHSVESTSSCLSKRTRRKINYRNTKPTTISSGTSPASPFHVAISESDFQSPPHPPCHNFGERKFKKQCPQDSQ
ncbi:hypothetical protein Tco_0441265 [Tanacetum coccineum]